MTIIVLNGVDKQIDNDSNVEQLLVTLSLDNTRLAVEINQEIIPRSDFSRYTFKDADKVEIVQAIGGGSFN